MGQHPILSVLIHEIRGFILLDRPKQHVHTAHHMGIQNRDYMKRPDDDDGRGSSSDSGMEGALSGFLERHPRFFVYVGVGIGVLVVIAIVVAVVINKGQ